MRKTFGVATALLVLVEVVALSQGVDVHQTLWFVIPAELLFVAGYVWMAWNTSDPTIGLIKSELRTWNTLGRLICRRQEIPAGSTPISASRGWWHLPLVITGASGVEAVVIELAIPWETVKLVVLLVSVYSLALAWGVFGARWTHPHYVDEYLHLRVSRREIAHVRTAETVQIMRGFHTEHHLVENGELILGGEGTNIVVMLSEPIRVHEPRWPWQRDKMSEVRCIRMWVDSPKLASAQLARLIHRDYPG